MSTLAKPDGVECASPKAAEPVLSRANGSCGASLEGNDRATPSGSASVFSGAGWYATITALVLLAWVTGSPWFVIGLVCLWPLMRDAR